MNGMTFSGNNVVYIDGKRADIADSKEINISVVGNIESLNVDCCKDISITGNVGTARSASGDIEIKGATVGSVQTTSGDITCGNVKGDVRTTSGDVDCEDVTGGINTVSGDIKHRKQ